MNAPLFDSFSDAIDATPAGAIMQALALKWLMLEDDLAWQRPTPAQETDSIIRFCRFIDAVKAKKLVMSGSKLPLAQVIWYRTTVERLIWAGELPEEVKEQFDDAFYYPSLKARVG